MLLAALILTAPVLPAPWPASQPHLRLEARCPIDLDTCGDRLRRRLGPILHPRTSPLV